MIQVFVTPEVEAGRNRGGEDLHLRYCACFYGETPPTEVEFLVALEDTGDYDGASVSSDYDEDDEDVVEEEGQFWSATRETTFTSSHYEFSWTGTAEDAANKQDYDGGKRVTAREYFLNPANWRFCHKPALGESPKLECCWAAYVNGNAD